MHHFCNTELVAHKEECTEGQWAGWKRGRAILGVPHSLSALVISTIAIVSHCHQVASSRLTPKEFNPWHKQFRTPYFKGAMHHTTDVAVLSKKP